MNSEALITSTEKIARSVVPILSLFPDTPQKLAICGTGFFIHERGFLATAAHVARLKQKWVLYDGTLLECEVLVEQLTINKEKDDPRMKHDWDIGVLQVQAPQKEFHPLRLSKKIRFRRGEAIAQYGYYDQGVKYKVGAITGLNGLLTTGIVSAATNIRIGHIEMGSRLILDISAGPGSSGSPVFDPATAEILGMIVSGKEKEVLGPGPNPNEMKIEHIPLGIAYSDPIIHLGMWLE
ncbi:MAG: serine protease, partial [Candidatus Hydrogenedentes bacterium]|nr:serine protease [Candidatus Hydrogenedentota bacterium]